MKENFEYKYIGKRNSLIRFESIRWTFLFFMFAFFAALFWDKNFSIFVVIIGVILIITLLLKIDLEDNVYLFTNEKIIHFKKNLTKEYLYSDLVEVNFIEPPRSMSTVRFKMNKKKFDFELNRKDSLDVERIDFVDFLLKKNEKLLITGGRRFEKYKYFRLDDSIISVEIN